MSEDEEQFGEVEFLGWYLLLRLKGERDDQISRSKFLKLCCITDRHLIEEYEYDVGLPRYWYMYGELANEHEFGGRFYNAPTAIGWEGQQYLPKRTLMLDDFDISDDDVRTIQAAVEWTVQNFGNENVENIKKHQYEQNAPNEFVKRYSELRWLLNTVDLGGQHRLGNFTEQGDSNREHIERLLDELMREYPTTDRFTEVERIYRRWDDTVRLLLERNEDYGELKELLDRFIEFISKRVLRFEYNRNIPEDRLRKWQETAEEAESEFVDELERRRAELLNKRDRSGALESVSEPYSQAVREQIDRLRRSG